MSSEFTTAKRSLYRPAILLESNSISTTESSHPRRDLPSPSPITSSPHPSQSLSLSDLDESLNTSANNTHTGPAGTHNASNTAGKSVLIIQTLDTTNKDANTTLVPITSRQVPSPVSVVRHVPSPPLSDTLLTEEHRFSSNFVNTATETRRSDQNEEKKMEKRNDEMSLSHQLYKDMIDDGSNTEEDDNIEQIPSKDVREFLGIEETLISKAKEFIHEDTSQVKDKENGVKNLMNKDQVSTEPKLKKSVKKKTATTHFVPSRYRAAATNYKKQETLNATMKEIPLKQKPMTTKVTQPILKKATNKKTRTSTFNGSLLNTTAGNISFNPSASATSTPADSLKCLSNSRVHSRAPTVPEKKKVVASVATKRTLPDICSKQSLLNIRLLQMTYLHVKFVNAKKSQEEQAVSQLYALWDAYEKQKHEISEIRKSIEHEINTQALDISIDRQLSALQSLCDKFAEVKDDHFDLSQALESTQHELPTKNILPVSEDALEEVISSAEVATSEAVACIKDNVEAVTSLAEKISLLAKTVEKEQKELERVWTQLQVTTKLQLHETSLYFEEVQRNDALT